MATDYYTSFYLASSSPLSSFLRRLSRSTRAYDGDYLLAPLRADLAWPGRHYDAQRALQRICSLALPRDLSLKRSDGLPSYFSARRYTLAEYTVQRIRNTSSQHTKLTARKVLAKTGVKSLAARRDRARLQYRVWPAGDFLLSLFAKSPRFTGGEQQTESELFANKHTQA